MKNKKNMRSDSVFLQKQQTGLKPWAHPQLIIKYAFKDAGRELAIPEELIKETIN